MRNSLLMTAAITALLAGTSLAAAQNENKPAQPGGSHAPAPQTQQHMTPPGSGGTNGNAPRGTERTPNTQAQSQPNQGPEQRGSGQQQGRGPNHEHIGPGNARGGGEQQRTGQGSNQGERPTQAQTKEPNGTAERGGDNGNNGGTSAQNRPEHNGGSMRLSQEQRTKIRGVLVQHDVVRVDHPTFSVTVGTRVPRDVHITVLPEEIVTLVPEYRGYEYVMVRDEILIIDPNTLEIVAIIPG